MSVPSEINRTHLLKWWIPILAFGALLISGIILGLTGGALRKDSTPFIAVGVAIAVVTFTTLRARRKVVALFREPTPDRAIAYYHRTTIRIPNGEAMAAYLSAFAAVLYGQFDRARDELAAVNWDSLPPMYQAFEAYIRYLLATFEAKDYSEAMRLAERIRELGSVAGKLPGAALGKKGAECNVAIAQFLLGGRSQELVNQLKDATAKLPGVLPALPAWSLAQYYRDVGDPSRAEQYAAKVRELLPHSILLTSLDLAQQASSATT